jgi:RHS repeat-associated protein
LDNHYKFTGKERDGESGLDYYGARYYSNTIGRFVSADWSAAPVPIPYASLTNPQTLNLYAMAHDNPSSFADLDGHLAIHRGARQSGSIAAEMEGVAKSSDFATQG